MKHNVRGAGDVETAAPFLGAGVASDVPIEALSGRPRSGSDEKTVGSVQTARAGGRLDRVDVLRAGAALTIVLYHHFGSFFGWHLPWSGNVRAVGDNLGHAMPLHVLSLGWVGVPLFFVLSGFCIHAGFARHREFNLGSFCWRRFWRIYPPYLAAVVVFAVWPIDWLGTAHGLRTLLANGFMVQNLMAGSFWSKFNPSFWSVPTEFQCYLLYPVFLFLGKFWGTSRVALAWFVFGCVGKTVVGALEGWPMHPIDYGLCFPLFTFGDWALGALVAEKLSDPKRSRWLGSSRVFALAVGFLMLSTLWRPATSLSFSLAAVCGALLVFNYAGRQTKTNFLERVLGGIGVASYSLYLWHQPLLGPLTEVGRNLAGDLPLNLARIVTLFVIAVGLALATACSYWLLERPSIAVAGSRPRRTRAASTAVIRQRVFALRGAGVSVSPSAQPDPPLA